MQCSPQWLWGKPQASAAAGDSVCPLSPLLVRPPLPLPCCSPVVPCVLAGAGQPRPTDERFNDFNFWRTELPILFDDREPVVAKKAPEGKRPEGK